MARRNDNECAFCAEEFDLNHGVVGRDWKVYCSANCAAAGEALSIREWRQLMSVALPSREIRAMPIHIKGDFSN
ncbi:MAG TPA: hypothetical protein PLD20_01365 [Blastocatellia bacterium]|nr:hypothetical protein [Blastocatellia bacterium]HMV83304.1 hypothetical protein [Blastocatellia bacterium]HMY73962.1 hypothetical protein [Blastocatellia bacterium]HMZ16585.1 hypothetical protein [Blastocatellia bacterium]HNG28222.1 hypothetical protein [Blastocatellia bacterium]